MLNLARRFAYTEEHDLFRDQVRKFFDRELVPQVWSLEQPAFKERVAALQAKISSR